MLYKQVTLSSSSESEKDLTSLMYVTSRVGPRTRMRHLELLPWDTQSPYPDYLRLSLRRLDLSPEYVIDDRALIPSTEHIPNTRHTHLIRLSMSTIGSGGTRVQPSL